MNNIIYHVCHRTEWQHYAESTHYSHDSLKYEGFIHCSEADQVAGVLTRYFSVEDDLLLLSIDASLLEVKVVYEEAPMGEKFPHIYGAINKSAIISVKNISSHG